MFTIVMAKHQMHGHNLVKTSSSNMATLNQSLIR